MEMGRGVIEGEVLASEREAAVDTHQRGIGNAWVNGLGSHRSLQVLNTFRMI